MQNNENNDSEEQDDKQHIFILMECKHCGAIMDDTFETCFSCSAKMRGLNVLPLNLEPKSTGRPRNRTIRFRRVSNPQVA